MATSLDYRALLTLKKIFIDGVERQVKSIRTDGKFLYVGLEDVLDRNAAELLRNKKVYAYREDLDLNPDTYLIEEMIGCKVVADGEEVGEICDIYQNGVAADVFEVKTPSGKILNFPFVKILCPVFDFSANTLTVDKNVLGQVSLYED